MSAAVIVWRLELQNVSVAFIVGDKLQSVSVALIVWRLNVTKCVCYCYLWRLKLQNVSVAFSVWRLVL